MHACLYVTDIYVACVSYTHQVASKGFFIALVSTTVETANPEAELKPGLDLLGPIMDKYASCKVQTIL
jgi:Rab GDP dissociation inhibitor